MAQFRVRILTIQKDESILINYRDKFCPYKPTDSNGRCTMKCGKVFLETGLFFPEDGDSSKKRYKYLHTCCHKIEFEQVENKSFIEY